MNPLRSCVAAFCGALLGGITAVSCVSVGFWWIGAFIGGVIAWIGYDPIAFWHGMKYAAQEALSELTAPSPYPAHVRQVNRWTIVAIWVVMYSMCLWMFLLMGPASDLKVGVLLVLANLIGLLFPFVISFPYLIDGNRMHRRFTVKEANEDIELCKKGVIYLNPFTMPFTVVWLILFRAVPFVVRFVPRMIVKTYHFTISDGRIAAFVGGSMGATAGYFLHQALVGAVFGAVVALSLAYAHQRRAREVKS